MTKERIDKISRKIGSFLMLLSLVIVIIGYKGSPKNECLSQDIGDIDYVSKNVKIVYEDGTEVYKDLPAKLETNRDYSIFIDLSTIKNLEGKSLALQVAFSNVECYADGKLFYKIEAVNNKWLKSGGKSNHLISLPPDLTNKVIEIKHHANIQSRKHSSFYPVYVGKKVNILLHFLLKKDFGIIALGFLLVVAFYSTLYFLIIGFVKKRYFKEAAMVGRLILSVLIFFMLRLWIVRYLFADESVFLYLIEYSLLMLFPYQVLQLLREKLDPKFNLLFIIGMTISYINIIIQYSLFIFTGRELLANLHWTHLVIVVDVIIMIVSTVLTDSKKYPNKRNVIITVFPLMFSTLIAIGLYILYKPVFFEELSMIAVLFFLASYAYMVVNKYADANNANIQTKIYKKLALLDELTGFGNRNAYTEAIQKINDEYLSTWIISFDLNNLKDVNDVFGHSTGDEMIRIFSKALKESFGESEDVAFYRVGGDEFVVFINKDKTYEPQLVINEIKMNLRKAPEPFGSIEAFFAYGVYYHDTNEALDVNESIHRADQKMYLLKTIYKKG